MLMLLATPLNADLTGDGVDESVEIGTKSIIVRDGATGRRYIPIRGESILDFIVFPSTDGSRSYIAVITEKRAAIVGGRTVRVLNSVEFPYEPEDYIFSEIPVTFYNLRTLYAIITFGGEDFLTLTLATCGGHPCFKESGSGYNTANIEAGESGVLHKAIEGNAAILVKLMVAGDPDKDIHVRAHYDGAEKNFGRVHELTAVFYNPEPRAKSLALFLDNTYSLFTGKDISILTASWKNPYVFR